MDEQPSGPREPAGPASRWTHDWFPLDEYENVHYSHMDALEAAGTVVSHALDFRRIEIDGEPVAVQLAGRVMCSEGVVVEVDKWLDVRRGRRNRLEVKGISYSYHAWRDESEIDLLRYDSSHGLEGLHRHFFDSRGQEVEVRAITLEDLPTLTGVIEEAVALAKQA